MPLDPFKWLKLCLKHQHYTHLKWYLLLPVKYRVKILNFHLHSVGGGTWESTALATASEWVCMPPGACGRRVWLTGCCGTGSQAILRVLVWGSHLGSVHTANPFRRCRQIPKEMEGVTPAFKASFADRWAAWPHSRCTYQIPVQLLDATQPILAELSDIPHPFWWWNCNVCHQGGFHRV